MTLMCACENKTDSKLHAHVISTPRFNLARCANDVALDEMVGAKVLTRPHTSHPLPPTESQQG